MSGIQQVVVYKNRLNYLCETVDLGWLCGACRGLIRPALRHKCGNCSAMVIEVTPIQRGSLLGARASDDEPEGLSG